MNKDNTHLMVQEQSITQLHDDDVFGEFQALWDEQNRRIDKFISDADERASACESYRLALHPRVPRRIRTLVLNAIFSFIILFGFLYWVKQVQSLTFNTLSFVVAIVIELIFVVLFSDSLYCTVRLIVCNPARKDILGMQRSVQLLDKRSAQSLIVSSVAIVAIAYSTFATTGDGYTMTQSNPNCVATIDDTSNTLSDVCYIVE